VILAVEVEGGSFHCLLFNVALFPRPQIPLAIMTSGDTDAPTRALLEREDYLGLSRAQVTVLMQDKVPALSDNMAKMVTDPANRWHVETKPHGHGDVHHLLHRSGLAKKWASEQGKEWVFFFQDTNPLVVHALIPMLGVSVDRKYDMNSLCVPRRAGEAAGAITKLTSNNKKDDKDGGSGKSSSLTINVEYNQLDPLLRATPGFEDGDVDDPETGFSPFPGNVNNLLVYLPTYEKVISGPDQGVVEEFVNPKYADASRTTFKKPTRLECMMQDLPKLMGKELPNANVGFTTMERWLTFSPAKNAPEAGAAAAANGSPPGSPASSEADVYGALRTMLRTACKDTSVEEGDEATFAGMPVKLLPAIQLDPSFAVTSSELSNKVSSLKVSGRSTLVVEGSGVKGLHHLTLDGALVVKCTVPGATLTIEGPLTVKNLGWEFVPAEVGMPQSEDYEVPEVLRIRGFRLLKHEAKVFEVMEAGDWVVRGDGVMAKKL
jgi:UDP-sugar pyrophosphorylase